MLREELCGDMKTDSGKGHEAEEGARVEEQETQSEGETAIGIPSRMGIFKGVERGVGVK